MFFLFCFISILIFIAIAIHTSKIGLEVENLIIDTDAENKISKKCKIYVYILIFNKIKLFKKNVKDLQLKDVKIKNRDIDIEILKNKYIEINYLQLLRNIDIDVVKIDLESYIGTEDAALTAIIVGGVSSILGIILKKPKFQIIPVFQDKNILKIKLNGIFTVYLMHYIYSLIKKIIVDKVESRLMGSLSKT